MSSSRTLTSVLALVAVFLLAPQLALAIVITTADGAGADAYVRSSLLGNNASNLNYGSEENVLVKHDTAINGNNRKIYIRFDLTALSGTLTNARLDLSYSGFGTDPTLPNADPSTYSVFGLLDGAPNEAWDESLITWNNAPGNDTASPGGVLGSETSFLGNFDLSISQSAVGDIISFSSAGLLSFIQADTDSLATLIIVRDDVNFGTELFAAKESLTLQAPSLDIATFDDPNNVPEPSTLSLLGIGVLAARFVRRAASSRG